MKAHPTTTKVKLTPKMALHYLDAHEALAKERGDRALNRNINDDLVSKYGKDMLDGKWALNGETIKIATTGRVLDGQHRLWASANNSVAFETMLVTDLPEETFYTIDIGRSRKASDFLTVDGIPYSQIVAPAARIVIGYRQKNFGRSHMYPSHEIVAFAKANKRLGESAIAAHNMNGIVSLSVAAAWHFLFTESDAAEADRFIVDLRDGVGLSAGDPVLALRERLVKNKASKAKLRSKDIFLLGLKAWNNRRSGKSTKRVRALADDVIDSANLPVIA